MRLNELRFQRVRMVGTLLLPALLFACKGNQQGMTGAGPQEYEVKTLKPSVSALKRTFPATIRGRQDVEIRPNISGFITRLCVDEGARVRKGQVLFMIDPVQYEAAVKSAEANVNVARTSVETSELTTKNKRELQKRNIISDYDLQMAENDLASKKALLAQAEAQLVNARNNLSYTEVKSPSDGVIGTIPFRVGSLVSPSMAVPMTTVSDISEMYVYFSMNEKQLLELTRQNGSLKESVAAMPEIELQLADGSLYGEKGKIEMVSGVIDPSTGAVSMRASFPNRENILRSGGSGNVVIPYLLEDVLTVPQNATYEIQDKKFVYKLDSGTVARSTGIEIFPLNDGQSYVVTSGLQPGDRIVVEGVSRLKDGMTINPKEE